MTDPENLTIFTSMFITWYHQGYTGLTQARLCYGTDTVVLDSSNTV